MNLGKLGRNSFWFPNVLGYIFFQSLFLCSCLYHYFSLLSSYHSCILFSLSLFISPFSYHYFSHLFHIIVTHTIVLPSYFSEKMQTHRGLLYIITKREKGNKERQFATLKKRLKKSKEERQLLHSEKGRRMRNNE